MDENEMQDKTVLFGEDQNPTGLPPPYLVIVDGPHKGARFPLKEGINVLGRLEECHVVLDDQSVSRKHAEVISTSQGWSVQDLQSKNGTYVNGAPIQESVVIGHKDLIRVGIYTLRFINQEIPAEEEMDIPPQDISELGTMLAGDREPSGETARMEGPSVPLPEKDITAPHSPLEEESAAVAKRRLPPVRVMGLLGVLFAMVLVAGLYFYWHFVLAPEEKGKGKLPPVAQQTTELQIIPLGPPEPVKPKTVPIFLDCVANPFPAMVRFQEKELGKTPLKINVDLVPGENYEITADFEMPEIQEKYTDKLHFSVTPEQSMTSLLFHAPLGTLKVTELPRDASLYLEGYYEYNKFQPKTVKVQNLVLNKPMYVPFGRYVAELKEAKEVAGAGNVVEDIVFHREFVLQEDQPTYILDVTEKTLQQLPVEIRSIPPGADVFIDQQKVGLTPFTGTLPLGKHTLTLRKDGYFENVQELNTDINTPLKTETTLKTSLAGEKLNTARINVAQGLHQEAIQALSEVFTLNPSAHETAQARYMLGEIFLQLKDYDKAQGYFEQAKEQEDYKYPAKLGIANVLSEKGDVIDSLVPLVEVLLNAKEESVLRDAHNLLRKISPLRSVVYIQSDPPGAQIYINDKKLGQVTPVLLHEMGLGSYHVRLEKAGFQPLEVTLSLSVNEFNPLFAKLKPLAQ